MPKVTFSQEQLKPQEPLPIGIYEGRLDGFQPRKAKDKPGKDPSVNLRPVIKIINHPTMNDKQAYVNGNTKFTPELIDLAHACGVIFEGEDPNDDKFGDEASFPGEFPGPESDPTKWGYIGPLAGQVLKFEIAEKVDGNGKPQTGVKRFFCRVPGCKKQHRESLL